MHWVPYASHPSPLSEIEKEKKIKIIFQPFVHPENSLKKKKGGGNQDNSLPHLWTLFGTGKMYYKEAHTECMTHPAIWR